MLSILLVTYNHSDYIGKAMESILQQNYVGDIELVIADDLSTDSTLDIIKKYDGIDPRFKFKYLKEETNLGTTRNYQRGFLHCTGRYIAVIEGDDYWVSPEKLNKQVRFLDEHYECSMVSHNYFVFEQDVSRFNLRVPNVTGFRYIGARDLISDNIIGNFSTCMYRKSELMKISNDVYDIKSYDWIINIILSKNALLGFLYEPLSVYRIHSSSVWSQISIENKKKQIIELIPLYDKLTNNVYSNEFNLLMKSYESNIVIKCAKTTLFKSNVIRLIRAIKSFTPPIIKYILILLLPPKFIHYIKNKVM